MILELFESSGWGGGMGSKEGRKCELASPSLPPLPPTRPLPRSRTVTLALKLTTSCVLSFHVFSFSRSSSRWPPKVVRSLPSFFSPPPPVSRRLPSSFLVHRSHILALIHFFLHQLIPTSLSSQSPINLTSRGVQTLASSILSLASSPVLSVHSLRIQTFMNVTFLFISFLSNL